MPMSSSSAPLLTLAAGGYRRILTYAGAILGFLIGSGFATGQEVLQYFTAYGYAGVFGTGGLVLILITYVCVEFLRAGQSQKFCRPAQVFSYYGGRYVGPFFDYFSIVFVFLSFAVMVAGAGAVFEEHYGITKYVGGIALAVIVAATVCCGLQRLVKVLGKVGPLIVVVAVGLGVAGLMLGSDGAAGGNARLAELEVTRASSNWVLAALSYVGFCMLWLATFLAALGGAGRSRREVTVGGLAGGVAFSAACMIVGLGLLANISRVNGAEIPMLILAGEVSPLLSAGFSVVILAGIYTTAVPLLWTVSSRIRAEEGRRTYGLTLGLAAAGTLIGLAVPFSQMVNVVYVINGYVGIALLILMVVKTVRRTAARRHAA